MEQKTQITTEHRFVSPEDAFELLKANSRNRPMKPARVLELVKEMECGRWVFNGEPIQFTKGGVMLNGQHRLAAIVKSKIGQEMFLMSGLEDRAFGTYDVGGRRGAADVLAINDIPNPRRVAAMIKAYIHLRVGRLLSLKNNGAFVGSCAITNTEVLEEYRKSESLFQEISKNSYLCYAKLKMMNASEIGGYMAYLIIEKNHPDEKVYSFFHQLTHSEGVENSTINVLREKLVNAKMTNYKMTSRYRKAVIIKTWNAFVQGKEFKTVTFNEVKDIYPEFM